MKNVLLLFTLGILAYYKEESAEEASVPVGDLEFQEYETDENSQYRAIDYNEDSINVTQSQNDAKSSIISRYYTISKENNELIANNSWLRTQIKETEKEIVKGLGELNMYRMKIQRRLKELADEMDELVEFNQKVGKNKELVGESKKKGQDLASFLQVFQNSTEKSTSGDDNDDNDEEIEESHGFIFVAGLFFIFLMLETVKYYSDQVLYSSFFQPFLSLLITLCIFSILSSILTLIYKAEIFEDSDLYFEEIYKGSFIFVLVWFAIGLWIIFAAQGIAIIWEKHEDKLCRGEVNQENKQFGIMRKLFISNPYLPVFTEKALRPDFNFSEYLRQCMGFNLSQIFSMNFLTFTLIIAEIVAWRLILRDSENFQFYSIWVAGFGILGISLLGLGKCWLICKKLVPDEGENLLIEYNYSSKSSIPLPVYLKSHIPPPNSELKIGSIYSLKLTCSYIFLGTYPNRHQLLFWFDSYGVKFLVSLFQVVIISQSLWITLVILYLSEIFTLLLGIILLVSTGLAMFVNVVFVLPLWTKFFTVASSVEMMKNEEIIKKVVENTQGIRMNRNWRLFWQFSSLWRDTLMDTKGEKLPKLPQGIKSLVKEAFDLSSTNWQVNYLEVKNILYRIGIIMDNDQFRVFLKDCEMDDFDSISYKNFIKGLKRMKNNIKHKPHKIVSEVLKYHLEKDQVHLSEISDFLQRNRWFMKDEDIHDFLVDLHFNLNSKNLVDLNEVEFSS